MSMIELIGRFHPVLVHLPIGIFTILLFIDAIATAERFKFLAPSVRFMLITGIITAVLSLVTGYCLSLEGSNNSDLVDTHQWTAIGTTALFLLFFLLRDKMLNNRFIHFFSLASMLSMLVLTGHQGGSLTHGDGFLTTGLLGKDQESVAELQVTDINQALAYKDIVQYTLNQKCVQCHGAEKQKGKLRLDAQQWIEAGGKNGKLINANEPDQSELIKRIMLDDIDDHHMPPKCKTQLTDAEKEIFQWWINSGASFAKTVASLQPDEKIIKSLNTFIENNKNTTKTVILQRPEVDPIDQATKVSLEKMGWVVSPISKDDNHLRLTAYNLEVPLKEALGALKKINENIVELKLSFTKANDVDVKNIGGMKNIEKLWLDQTMISDASLQELLTLEHLEFLSIVSTNTSAMGIKDLLKLPKLKLLFAKGTKLNAEDQAGLKSIAPDIKLNFGDSMKSAISDTIFIKKTE